MVSSQGLVVVCSNTTNKVCVTMMVAKGIGVFAIHKKSHLLDKGMTNHHAMIVRAMCTQLLEVRVLYPVKGLI